MRTIAVVNQKGGTAKTTSAVNLAAALAELERSVLLIDLDSQANATDWVGVSQGGRRLLEALRDDDGLAELIVTSPIPGVDLIPAGPALASADKVLAAEMGPEMRLRDGLAQLPAGRWDVVLIDCPPGLGILSLSALVACQEVLVPVETRTMAVSGLVRLLETIAEVRRRYPPGPALLGILPCRVDMRTRLSVDVVDALRERLGQRVFRTVIRENIRLAEAFATRESVLTFARSSAGASDYRRAADELIERTATWEAA